jgi:hypothetical protein
MSALPTKADTRAGLQHVCFGANRRRSLADTATVRERPLCCRSPKAISGDGEDYFYPPCGSLKAFVGC